MQAHDVLISFINLYLCVFNHFVIFFQVFVYIFFLFYFFEFSVQCVGMLVFFSAFSLFLFSFFLALVSGNWRVGQSLLHEGYFSLQLSCACCMPVCFGLVCLVCFSFKTFLYKHLLQFIFIKNSL